MSSLKTFDSRASQSKGVHIPLRYKKGMRNEIHDIEEMILLQEELVSFSHAASLE